MKKGTIALILLYITINLLTACTNTAGTPASTPSSVIVSESNTAAEGKNKALSGLQGLPDEFQNNVSEHIRNLSSFGMRYAGSKSEESTIGYIYKYFNQLGIYAKEEKFSFQYFDSNSITLTINGVTTNCEQILINPYENTRISGKGILYNPDTAPNVNLKDQIVVAKNSTGVYQLLNLNTRVVVVISETDFESIRKAQELAVDIIVTGSKQDLSSSNIIGSITPAHQTDKEIVISAHWDSFKGPGASDNASGIGVLLELAKYYSSMKESLPCTIKFIAFGSEELGMLGSKAYVLSHSDELKNCKLLFNIDEVGGNQDIFIEMNRGNENQPGELQLFNPEIMALTDYTGKWILNMPLPTYINVPDWLKNDINKSCEELNYKYIPGNGMGSDHQVFAQIGIPSTNICVAGGIKTHSPDDSPDKINLDSLRKSGEIVACVVNKSFNR